MIVRHVKVDRMRSPQEVLNATDANQHTDRKVVNSMPRGEGDEVDVFFFKIDHFVSEADLDSEYRLRGLKPDPYAQAAVNEADLGFVNKYPNATHWLDADGNWCHVAFNRFCGREVRVFREDTGWDNTWWFAGVRG